MVAGSAGTIVVAFDGSPHADAALVWAARTAALEERPVRAVIVEDGTSERGSAADSASDDLADQVGSVLADAGATGALERYSGDAESVILEQAQDAEMLVAGSRGRGPAASTLLGSVSQHLARHATCPLVVVRREPRADATRILVGIDGSSDCVAALRFACRRAALTKETVAALHAWNPGRVQLDYHGQLPETLADRSEAADALLAETVADARREFPEVSVVPESVAMPASEALTDASANASLVVTGSRGLGAVTGLLLGSVSQHLLHHAHCPVAVIR